MALESKLGGVAGMLPVFHGQKKKIKRLKKMYNQKRAEQANTPATKLDLTSTAKELKKNKDEKKKQLEQLK